VQRAPGIPCALISRGTIFLQNFGRYPRRGIAEAYLAVIASAAKQSIFLCVGLWIASRSLSSGAHSRDPLARNDGLNRLSSRLFEIETNYLRRPGEANARHTQAVVPALSRDPQSQSLAAARKSSTCPPKL
jgi:hypothetical protein